MPRYPLQDPGCVGDGLWLRWRGVGEGHVAIQQRLGLAELLQLRGDVGTGGGAQHTRQTNTRHADWVTVGIGSDYSESMKDPTMPI